MLSLDMIKKDETPEGVIEFHGKGIVVVMSEYSDIVVATLYTNKRIGISNPALFTNIYDASMFVSNALGVVDNIDISEIIGYHSKLPKPANNGMVTSSNIINTVDNAMVGWVTTKTWCRGGYASPLVM